jgi:hypothetical protein
VIVCDLYVRGITILPSEADAPLIINADAVLALTVAAQLLQPVSLDCCQVTQSMGRVEHLKFPLCRPLYRLKSPDPLPIEQAFRIGRAEGLDHTDDDIIHRIKCKALNRNGGAVVHEFAQTADKTCQE